MALGTSQLERSNSHDSGLRLLFAAISGEKAFELGNDYL